MSSRPPDDRFLPASLVDAWQAARPSAAEKQRGFARYLRRQSKRRSPLRFPAFVLGGVVLGASLAQAANLVQARWLTPQASLHHAPPAVLQVSAISTGPAPAVPATSQEAPSASAARPVPRLATASATPAERRLEVQRQWQRVAEALRVDDFERARNGLLDIERSVGGAERDAARLARAQLLAGHGHAAEGLSLASALATQAGSELTRQQARELISRLQQNDAGDRSSTVPPAAKKP